MPRYFIVPCCCTLWLLGCGSHLATSQSAATAPDRHQNADPERLVINLDGATDLRSLLIRVREQVVALGLTGDWMFVCSTQDLDTTNARAVTLQVGTEQLDGYLMSAARGTYDLMMVGYGSAAGVPEETSQLVFSYEQELIDTQRSRNRYGLQGPDSATQTSSAAIFLGAAEEFPGDPDERALRTPATAVLRALRGIVPTFTFLVWPIPRGPFELDERLVWRQFPRVVALQESPPGEVLQTLTARATSSGYQIEWQSGQSRYQIGTDSPAEVAAPLASQHLFFDSRARAVRPHPHSAGELTQFRWNNLYACVATPTGFACVWSEREGPQCAGPDCPETADQLLFIQFDQNLSAVGTPRVVGRGGMIRSSQLAVDADGGGFVLLWHDAPTPWEYTLHFARLARDGRPRGTPVLVAQGQRQYDGVTLHGARLVRGEGVWSVATTAAYTLSIRTIDSQNQVSEATTLLDRIDEYSSFDVIWFQGRPFGVLQGTSECRLSGGESDRFLPCPDSDQHGPLLVSGTSGVGVVWAEPMASGYRIMFGELSL